MAAAIAGINKTSSQPDAAAGAVAVAVIGRVGNQTGAVGAGAAVVVHAFGQVVTGDDRVRGDAGAADRAYRDYLQRKFRERFRLLIKASSTDEVAKILRGSRSKDKVIRYLRENPHKVLYWLECGKPGNTHMDVEPPEYETDA